MQEERAWMGEGLSAQSIKLGHLKALGTGPVMRGILSLQCDAMVAYSEPVTQKNKGVEQPLCLTSPSNLCRDRELADMSFLSQ